MKRNNNKSDKKDTSKKKKRIHNKYSYALKRRVVNDILLGIISKEEAMHKYSIRSRQSINYWLNKYGLMNYDKNKKYDKTQSPEERIKELEAKVYELESDKIILNMVIDIADEQFNTNIRKKHLPQQSKDYKKHHKFLKKGK